MRNVKISTTYIVKHAFTTTALDNHLLLIVEDATICYSVGTLIHYNIFIFTDILGYKTSHILIAKTAKQGTTELI